ncbi:hypothetical protein MMPV_002637 [Pyropia vietnamensis]
MGPSDMARKPLKVMARKPLKVMARKPLKDVVRSALKGMVRNALKGMVRNPLKGMVRNPLKGMVRNPLKGMVRNPLKGMVRNPLKGMGHGGPPPQGYGGPPPQGYGPPPAHGYGAPPVLGYGAPPPHGHSGPPHGRGPPLRGGCAAPLPSGYPSPAGTEQTSGAPLARRPAAVDGYGGGLIEFELHASGLRDRDVLSGSDPMAVLFLWSTLPAGVAGVCGGGATAGWVEVGRTERVDNTQSPRFDTRITVPFQFEVVQYLRVRIVDVDDRKSGARLVDQDDLGEAFSTVGEAVSSGVLMLPLEPTAGLASGVTSRLGGKESWGTVTLLVHLGGGMSGKLRVRLIPSATNSDRKDGPFGKSDPYLLIQQMVRPATWAAAAVMSKLYRSPTIRKELNPMWPATTFTMEGRGSGELRFEVWDSDTLSSDDIIGGTSMTLSALSSPGTKTLPLMHPAKVANARPNRPAKPSGQLHLTATSVELVPTLAQYLSGGLELHFGVAIDFTASNGSPSSPTSLHYDTPAKPSAYVEALTSVGAVLEPYSCSHRYEAVGFGAQLPSGEVSHRFALTGEPFTTVKGVEGIVAAYRQALGEVKLAGPTNFAEVIRHASITAASLPVTPSAQGYMVLLLLTDGVITDMPETKEAIVAAAAVPLSIIIVGVGRADFSRMSELDGDELAQGGAVASEAISTGASAFPRDIVQFVPMAKHCASPPALAAQVLAELPAQVVDYMSSRRIMPMGGT